TRDAAKGESSKRHRTSSPEQASTKKAKVEPPMSKKERKRARKAAAQALLDDAPPAPPTPERPGPVNVPPPAPARAPARAPAPAPVPPEIEAVDPPGRRARPTHPRIPDSERATLIASGCAIFVAPRIRHKKPPTEPIQPAIRHEARLPY
ncbi:hypothetical protein E4U11_001333, partial [Claviceps purpurea]